MPSGPLRQQQQVPDGSLAALLSPARLHREATEAMRFSVRTNERRGERTSHG